MNTHDGLRRWRSFASSASALWVLAVLFAPAAASPLPSAEPETVGMSAQRLARLDDAIEREIERENVAGIVVAVTRRGRIVHNRAYGYANREEGVEMETDHLFRLYSMTKPVASVALLTLYEQGLFQLTDPLDAYIPELRDLRVFAGFDDAGQMVLEEPLRRPTIQDAFRHTLGLASGVGQHPVDLLYREQGISMGQLESLREQMHKLGTVPLRYQPGAEWVYGLGHDVQAYLVEVFSGMPYDEYLRQAIFEPLGMHDTVFGVPEQRQPRFARVYQRASNGEGLQPQSGDSYARYTTRPFGTLSLSSSTEDYLRFAQMLLNGGELDGVRVLGRKTVELMAQNHLPSNIPYIGSGPPGGSGYGLGVSVALDTAALGRLGTAGSFGWGGAATTTFSVDPAEDLVIVIMAQKQPNDTPLLRQVESLIYQALID